MIQHVSDRILLATNDLTLEQAVRETLERNGFELLVANNGRDAIRTFRTHAPKAIIIHSSLPFHGIPADAGGATALEILTDLDPFRPVLLLAEAGAKLEHVTMLMADRVERLPISPSALLESLNTLLGETLRERACRKSAELAALL